MNLPVYYEFLFHQFFKTSYTFPFGNSHHTDSHPCMSSKDDSGNSVAITQLIFIPGRTSEATATGDNKTELL